MLREDRSVTVLLTGIGGFVGHHVFEHIMKNTEWHVVGVASWRHRGRLARLSTLDERPEWRDRLTLVHHDMRAPFTWPDVRRAGLVDRVLDVMLNVASESHVDRSIADPADFVRNNVDLQLTALQLAQRLQPRLFVQFSTDEVYGPVPPGVRSREWDPIVPSNPYAASKAAQESLSVAWWRTFGVPLVVTNTMNVIGERQDPEKFLPMVIKRLVSGEPITVHCAPYDGEPHSEEDLDLRVTGAPGSRFYVHARNVADALLFIVDRYLGDPRDVLPRYPYFDRPARFNVVGEREVRNDELVLMVQAALDELGVPYPTPTLDYVDFHSSRPGHDLRYALDGRLLREAGWVPPVKLRESLRRTVQWYVEHPEWLA